MSDLDVHTKNCTLLYGDCLERMKEIPDGSIDAVICDPPYGTIGCSWDTIIPLKPMWEALNRVLKKEGVVVLFAGQPFTSILITSNLKNFKYSWIWEKSLKTNFFNAKKQPLRKHEDITVFCSGIGTYNPQGLKKDIGVTKQGKTGSSVYNNLDRPHKFLRESTNYPCDIIKCKSVQKSRIHPSQKPVTLMSYLIRTYSNVQETILDFTFGSGSTLVAAKEMARKIIGIENNEEYFKAAKHRLGL